LFRNIDVCVQATRFHEVFLDFLAECFPDVSEYTLKNYYHNAPDNRVDAGKTRNMMYSIHLVERFLEWLNRSPSS
jgi:hypothetical protein